MKKNRFVVLVLSALMLLASCTEKIDNALVVDRVPQIYPDYIEVTIPQDIAPLNFNVEEPNTCKVDVTITGTRGGRMHLQGEWAEFDIAQWHALTAQNVDGELLVQVSAKNHKGEWTQFLPFSIYISKYSLDDYGLTYRLIQPGYEVGGNIGIYQRNLHSFQEEAMITETAVPGRCFNCHTSNRTNPHTFTMQVRGEGGGTLVQKDGQQLWYNTKTNQTKAAGSYAYWHPSGRYCAYAVNSVHQSFFVGQDRNIEVYHKFGDVAVLDTETDELILPPLLQTDDVEIFPAFSADGATLYYSTSPNCEVPAQYEKVQCSLCSISFDANTGTFASQADTLFNGPATGKSYVLARPSYDGKWLMYCVASRGNFPVCQVESDLWLMNLATKETYPLDNVNTPHSESYHNWSSNSRWFVYSSKGEDGMHSLAYFASIDDDGNATKPFLLPQRNPRQYYRNSFYSYNCPDFTKTKVPFDIRTARKHISSDDRKPVKPR